MPYISDLLTRGKLMQLQIPNTKDNRNLVIACCIFLMLSLVFSQLKYIFTDWRPLDYIEQQALLFLELLSATIVVFYLKSANDLINHKIVNLSFWTWAVIHVFSFVQELVLFNHPHLTYFIYSILPIVEILALTGLTVSFSHHKSLIWLRHFRLIFGSKLLILIFFIFALPLANLLIAESLSTTFVEIIFPIVSMLYLIPYGLVILFALRYEKFDF